MVSCAVADKQKGRGQTASPTIQSRIQSLERRAKELFDRYTVPWGLETVVLRTSRPVLTKCGVEFGVAELRAHKPSLASITR